MKSTFRPNTPTPDRIFGVRFAQSRTHLLYGDAALLHLLFSMGEERELHVRHFSSYKTLKMLKSKHEKNFSLVRIGKGRRMVVLPMLQHASGEPDGLGLRAV